MTQQAVSFIEGARVYPFGSAVNGFGDRSSDIDLVLHAPSNELKRALDLAHVEPSAFVRGSDNGLWAWAMQVQ